MCLMLCTGAAASAAAAVSGSSSIGSRPVAIKRERGEAILCENDDSAIIKGPLDETWGVPRVPFSAGTASLGFDSAVRAGRNS